MYDRITERRTASAALLFQSVLQKLPGVDAAPETEAGVKKHGFRISARKGYRGENVSGQSPE